jgi:hypothetical protein
MKITEISVEVLSGGQSIKIATSTTSAPAGGTTAATLPTNAVKGAPISYLVTPDATCFVRKGTGTVTAVSDGTDQIMLANNSYRVELMEGEKLAFILASGTGNVYMTPGA